MRAASSWRTARTARTRSNRSRNSYFMIKRHSVAFKRRRMCSHDLDSYFFLRSILYISTTICYRGPYGHSPVPSRLLYIITRVPWVLARHQVTVQGYGRIFTPAFISHHRRSSSLRSIGVWEMGRWWDLYMREEYAALYNTGLHEMAGVEGLPDTYGRNDTHLTGIVQRWYG